MITPPSKKALSVFILAAASVASIIIAFGRDKASSAIDYTNNLLAGNQFSIPENSDWQNDFKAISSASIPQSKSTSTAESLTDTVSKALMANYLSLKQTGNLNSDSAQKLISQTIDFINQSDNGLSLNSKLDIIADNGKETIYNYGESLGNIFKINQPEEIKKESEIIQDILESGGQNEVKELDSIINTYQEISDELIAMPVPKNFVRAHTDMVIGLMNIINGLKNVENMVTDPIQGLQGVQTYQSGSNMFLKAMQATIKYIDQNNIIYKQDTGGYYLLHGI